MEFWREERGDVMVRWGWEGEKEWGRKQMSQRSRVWPGLRLIFDRM